MRDWAALHSDSKRNKGPDCSRVGLKASLHEGLRRTLRDNVDDGKQAGPARRAGDLLTIEKQRRKANRSFLERLDNACRHGAGVALADFWVHKEELRPLRRGEKRPGRRWTAGTRMRSFPGRRSTSHQTSVRPGRFGLWMG